MDRWSADPLRDRSESCIVAGGAIRVRSGRRKDLMKLKPFLSLLMGIIEKLVVDFTQNQRFPQIFVHLPGELAGMNAKSDQRRHRKLFGRKSLLKQASSWTIHHRVLALFSVTGSTSMLAGYFDDESTNSSFVGGRFRDRRVAAPAAIAKGRL